MSAQRVRFWVADWEIECCAPPPVVGGTTAWMLEFEPSGDQPDPLLDEEHEWIVDAGAELRRGRVRAHWGDPAVARPAPGATRLRGRLRGTVHSERGPDDLPQVEGRVDRIRLLRQEYREVQDRYWEPVPGTVTAEDLGESPRWFGSDLPSTAARPFGLLLDVTLLPG